MFSRHHTHKQIGTTAPIFVPRADKAPYVLAGKDYFLVQIHSAQAAFHGPIYERVKSLIIASKVNLNHNTLSEDGVMSIQRTRAVTRNQSSQLGLRPNLIDLVPAVMAKVSISLDFILDKENYLSALGGLINSDAFLAAVSLAPGAATVAKTISGLAGKIIPAFIPSAERAPILEFTGDFNIAGEGDSGENCLQDGYYVIVGTRDENNPLPSGTHQYSVQNSQLLMDGSPVTQLSYVIFDVYRSPARLRERNNGAAWDKLLREAEDEAGRVGKDPLAGQKERKASWRRCHNLLKEGQVLLQADPNYHRSEAETMFYMAFNACLTKLGLDANSSNKNAGVIKASRGSWQPDVPEERAAFEIPLEKDVLASISAYERQVSESRKVLDSIKG